MFTFEELKERVKEEYDPDLICEMLDISTIDLIEAFEDRFRDPNIISKFGWVIEEEKNE